ncbi:uncharacterized protein LOC134271423 [Saccostrea cucullata]|uniref:uncharacterized protein LOC134271423 n=1 Tax=Saccostrea cuccullata TaxID=36930 RepID=UPI002ED5EB31
MATEAVSSTPVEGTKKTLTIVVIYAKEDGDEASTFKEHLQNDILQSERNLNVEIKMLNDTEIKSLEESSEEARFAFLLLTKAFCEDSWPRVSQENYIRALLYGTEGKSTLVPIFTKNRGTADFRIPMGLNILKGLRYCDRDEFYKASMIKLLFN